jgi:cell wall assembly regulator SMI1
MRLDLPPTHDCDASANSANSARLRQHAERSGAEPKMPAPVTEPQFAAAERRLGRPLPADLRALYLEADGDGDSEAPAGYGWLPLDGSLAERDAYIGVPTWFGCRAVASSRVVRLVGL